MTNGSTTSNHHRGILARLLRDRRGNTLALFAGMLIPLLGMLGGGIDMSRLYLTKTRLQHACDAGALAGRKAMADGVWTTTGTGNSNSVAESMFDGNFKQYDYGTGTRTRTFSESAGSVTGNASAIVPMAIMQIFGITSRTLNVTCTANLLIPNTDVMFVLDVTGSMNCVAGSTSCTNNNNVPANGSKIQGIKRAVKCFYEALVKVNTLEVCGTNDPVASTYNGTAQIRIGFVPYSVNVNVGRLLPTSAIADTWFYQTRVAQTFTTTANYWEEYFDPGYYNLTLSECRNWQNPGTLYLGGGLYDSVTSTFPYDNSFTTGGTNGEWGWSGAPKTSSNNRSCRRLRKDTVTTVRANRLFKNWAYQRSSHNVSGLKSGTSWNSTGTVSLPIGANGTNTPVEWDGCIEERNTESATTRASVATMWDPIPTTAFDMDIDKPASSATSGTQWGPLLPDAVWARTNSDGDYTLNTVQTDEDMDRVYSTSCTTEAKKLQPWTTSGPFETYVNSLTAIGNTYHDIGMIWGARFLSRTGMFAAENDNRTRIDRHLIFMTDGDTMSYNSDYSAYGVHWWDRRQTVYAPASNSGYDSDTADVINARLTAMCTAIRNKQITLWVISYGGGINAATEARLTACASPGRYYSATNTTALIARFKQIAADIAELRLTN